ncbi:MAG: hypothetical protein LBC20_13985 [Planctomycetaceae bacterium]|nr:hypothetical protein [Planctomycetaceae bacterium]
MFRDFLNQFVDWMCFGPLDPISEEQREAAKKANVHSIVKNLSRGNTSLQQGRYQTEEDLNRLREENDKYCFN